jgi:DivIVA domain-containing protein
MVDPASIRNASFSLTPTGYNPEEVDRYLAELADGIATADAFDVRNASFSLTPTGYNPEEVDEYLSQIADALSGPGPAPAAVEEPAAPQTAEFLPAPEPPAVAAAPPAWEAAEAIEAGQPAEPAIAEPAAELTGPVTPAEFVEPEPVAAQPAAVAAVPEPAVRNIEPAAAEAPVEPAVSGVPAEPVPAVFTTRPDADLNGLAGAVESTIAALQRFVENELAAVREATTAEVDAIYRERQRLIDEAVETGRQHLDGVRAHADRLLAEANRDRQQAREALASEIGEQRRRFEAELSERRTDIEREAQQILSEAEQIRREAEELRDTAAQAQAHMLASFEHARSALIDAAQRTQLSQFHVVPENEPGGEQDAADAAA